MGRELVKLKDVQEGKLIRFKGRSDVYRVVSSGFFITLLNMYTEVERTVKCYTNKGNRSLDRTVEIVRYY